MKLDVLTFKEGVFKKQTGLCFIVKQPLVAVVVMTGAKEEVR